MNHFSTAKKYVTHISSLCGIQATPSLSLYCAGKAARDMFHKVLALESVSLQLILEPPISHIPSSQNQTLFKLNLGENIVVET